jgi:SSS family solute:Na+ symporter/sodium/proline symporter
MVVVLGIVGFIALRFFSTILQMALWAYTMYGAAITPALLAAFFWRRATRAGGVASIASGMIVTLGWEIYARSAGGEYLFALPTVYPAFAASVLALIFVSLGTPAPSEQELAAVR